MEILIKLSCSKLTSYEKQIYKLLVLIEKELGWGKMVRCMSKIFVYGSNESAILSKKEKLGSNEKRRPELFNHYQSTHKSASKKEQAREDTHTESRGTEEIKVSERKYEIEGPSEIEEDKAQYAIKRSAGPYAMKKRVCEKIDNALVLLYNDLTTYYDWNSEEELNDPSL